MRMNVSGWKGEIIGPKGKGDGLLFFLPFRGRRSVGGDDGGVVTVIYS